MALKLEEEYKGILANYWKIIKMEEDYTNSKTIVSLGLYKDATTRQQSVHNYLKTEKFEISQIELTREKAYIEIKKPIYEEIDGQQIQLNKFYDAEDC